jgi:hypothetical protein
MGIDIGEQILDEACLKLDFNLPINISFFLGDMERWSFRMGRST